MHRRAHPPRRGARRRARRAPLGRLPLPLSPLREFGRLVFAAAVAGLAAAISIRGSADWRAGLLWGAAGYAVFFVAPSLGLPPELPGSLPGPLLDRQIWWLGTVACSAAGLWLAAFGRGATWRIAGLALIALPHLIGAPRPVALGGSAPEQLEHHFARATYVVNAVFWATLGVLVSLFLGRRRV